MKKRICAILLSMAVLYGTAIPVSAAAAAASKLIPTNIPTKFTEVKFDSSLRLVTFWHAIGGFKGVCVSNIASWFNATIGKQKKIFVKAIYQGDYDAIATKICATVQSGNPKALPDLVQLSSQGAFTVKESNKVVFMEDMMANDSSYKIRDKLNKNQAFACSYKGKQLGMPFGNSMIMLHYNADAFRAAGLDPNNPPKTIADFAGYAKKLVIKGAGTKPKRYGGACRVDLYELETWVPRQKGGTAFEFDMEEGRLGIPTKFICGEDGTLKATFTEWKKALDTGCVEYNTASPQTNFTNGLNAMFIQSMANYVTIDTNFASNPKLKFDHMLFRAPLVNANDALGEAIGGNAVYMMDRGSEQAKKDTWEFVKFLTTVDVAAYWSVQSGYYPVNNDAVNTKYVQDYQNKSPNGKVIFKVLEDSANNYKFQEPWIPYYGQFNVFIGDQVTLLAQNKITVDQITDKITKKAAFYLKMYADANE